MIKPRDCILILLVGIMLGGALSACTPGDDASITSVPKYQVAQNRFYVVVDKDTCVEYLNSRSSTAEVIALRVDREGYPVVNRSCIEGANK